MLAKRFTNRLLLTNLVILFALLVCGGVALAFVLGGFLRADFRTQQGYRVDKMAEQLDGVLDEMNRLSISILASRRISDIMQSIPRDDRNNYFLIHPATRYEVLNLLLSYTALKPLKGRICLVSDGATSSTCRTSRTRGPSLSLSSRASRPRGKRRWGTSPRRSAART